MPDEMVAKARSKLNGFQSLKSDIDSDLAVIHERIEIVKEKIRDNVNKDKKQDGLLTLKEADYLSCLEFGYERLELLFREDEAKWTKEIDQVKQKANYFDK